MSSVKLKGYAVNEIEFINELKTGGKLELKNELKYNVKYSEAQSRCIGECRFKVYHSTRPDLFSIEINMRGFFEFDPEADKRDVHHESYDELFPYVRALISTLTVNCGMPAVTIPKIEIDSENVVLHENGDRGIYS